MSTSLEAPHAYTWKCIPQSLRLNSHSGAYTWILIGPSRDRRACVWPKQSGVAAVVAVITFVVECSRWLPSVCWATNCQQQIESAQQLTMSFTSIDTAIQTSVFFKLGLRPLDDHSVENVLGQEVKTAYQALSEEVKKLVSLLDFSLLGRGYRGLLKTVSAPADLDFNLEQAIEQDLQERCDALRYAALNWIRAIPPDASSEVIDGYMATCVQQRSLSTKRLDQWNYAPRGRLEQSCESLSPSSLFSATTVQNLLGKNVHFMMFDEGATKIKCYRFQFGESQLDTDANALGDPIVVEKTFCRHLDLSEDVQKKLPIHASRLEMAQNVLGRITNVLQPETQALFDHVLSMILHDLESTTPNFKPVVDHVAGMKDMVVIVEVCKAYLRAQAEAKGQPTGNIVSLKKTLTIRSDLAVSVLPASSLLPGAGNSDEADDRNPQEQKLHRLLYCNYHIEMKIAHGELKHGGRQPKSQLLAESLARSIELNTLRTPRKVLFSFLTDCCSLYVLVHFPDSGNAYLSRREVEPGRMVAVIAWVHLMSSQVLSESSTFSEESFIGKFSIEKETFASEFRKQKRTNNMNTTQNPSNKRQAGSGPAPKQTVDMEMKLIAETEDEVVAQRIRSDQEAFVAYRNHYNLGWPLPLMIRNLVVRQEADSLRQERLARAGLV
jgi:hypothetical protein